MFRRLVLQGWRQFGDVTLDFDSRLTVLTGQNGTGKTTILRLLGRHLGWQMMYVATPRKTSGGTVYEPDVGDHISSIPGRDAAKVGQIDYENGSSTDLLVERHNNSAQYDINIEYNPIPGIFVESHRALYQYRRVGSIPTQAFQANEVFSTIRAEAMSRFRESANYSSPSFRLKEALVSWAVFGYADGHAVAADLWARQAFEGFERVLQIMLPASLQFRRLKVEMPEVVLETGTGRFSVDGASGGISAIIDLVWQIYVLALVHNDQPFVLVIDEPENHLHPALQRELMPKLLNAFPRAQVVVATHSPFIISAERTARVYALTFSAAGPVEAQLLDQLDRSGSANEILRSALGVGVTMPVWAETELAQIIDDFQQVRTVDITVLAELRHRLRQGGLADYAAQALTDVLRARQSE